MNESLNDNERLLIKLEQQLENTNKNQEKVMELTTEIFSKIDGQLKDIFDIKSKVETMREVNELKIEELKNQISYGNTKAKNIETDFKEFKESKENTFKEFKDKEFKPLVTDIERAKGALFILKYIYPTVAIILEVIGLGIAIWLKR
jgi:endonuclease III